MFYGYLYEYYVPLPLLVVGLGPDVSTSGPETPSTRLTAPIRSCIPSDYTMTTASKALYTTLNSAIRYSPRDSDRLSDDTLYCLRFPSVIVRRFYFFSAHTHRRCSVV